MIDYSFKWWMAPFMILAGMAGILLPGLILETILMTLSAQ